MATSNTGDFIMHMNIRKMKNDDTGIVTRVSAKGELGRRIRDMGIVPGTEFTIVGRAPLYDPVAIRLKGFTLTLRNNEADYVYCESSEE